MNSEKIAVFAPMPIASVRIAMVEKPGFLREQPDGVAQVAGGVAEPRKLSASRVRSRGERRAAEPTQRLAPRLIPRHAAADVLFGSCIEVEPHLLVEDVVRRAATDRAAKAGEPAHCAPLTRTQELADRLGQPVPLGFFFREPLVTSARQPVEEGAAGPG